MKVITFLNEKGGVGKTPLAIHTAAGLAIMGNRVIFIDGDPQGTATNRFYVGKAPGLYGLLVQKQGWHDVLTKIDPKHWGEGEGEIYLCPNAIMTDAMTRQLLDVDPRELAYRLNELDTEYVVIDTSPAPSGLHTSLLVASDAVYIPCTMKTEVVWQSVPETIEHMEHIPKQPTGIIPTQYRLNRIMDTEMLRQLHDTYGDIVFEPLRESNVYDYASAAHTTLFVRYPNDEHTDEVWRMIERIAEDG